jgi:hypothetical protein
MIPWWLRRVLNGEWGVGWSDEEINVNMLIWGIALVAFLLLFLGGIVTAQRLGLRTGFDGVGAPLLVTSVPTAVYLGRRLSTLFWPTLTKVADENAAKRIADRNRDRGN